MSDETEMQTLSWPHGMLQVHPRGGMFGPGTFLLSDGRQVSPFYVAPWWNEPESASLDGLMKTLRGEWPCVPFGFGMPKESFPPDWQDVIDNSWVDGPVHGYGSNHDWTFEPQSDPREVRLYIDYPADEDVARLERVIAADPDAAAIEVGLRIFARKDCRVPVALHGCFAVPDAPGAVELVPGNYRQGLTHPTTVEPGVDCFMPSQSFQNLDAVPGRDGGVINAAQLPLDRSAEELLQLNDCDGHFDLLNHKDGYQLRFDWDASLLPSVLLWYSNKGRQYAPWNGRCLSIGIEPTASAFGLAPQTSVSENPIAQDGTRTWVECSAAQPVDIRYRISVSNLPA